MDNSKVKEISKILYQYDPAELNFDFNDDEYDLEAEIISTKLSNLKSKEELQREIYKICLKYIGSTKKESDPLYASAAKDIWKLSKAWKQ